MSEELYRIESEFEVSCYIRDLKYALEHGAQITFQQDRSVDRQRDIRFTNRFTVTDLFPNENPVDALKRELGKLTVEEYLRTVKDLKFQNRSEMREFGRVYNGADDVYIKIRVELLSSFGGQTLFVMSFHYAVTPFSPEMFPYKHRKEV